MNVPQFQPNDNDHDQRFYASSGSLSSFKTYAYNRSATWTKPFCRLTNQKLSRPTACGSAWWHRHFDLKYLILNRCLLCGMYRSHVSEFITSSSFSQKIFLTVYLLLETSNMIFIYCKSAVLCCCFFSDFPSLPSCILLREVFSFWKEKDVELLCGIDLKNFTTNIVWTGVWSACPNVSTHVCFIFADIKTEVDAQVFGLLPCLCLWLQSCLTSSW